MSHNKKVKIRTKPSKVETLDAVQFTSKDTPPEGVRKSEDRYFVLDVFEKEVNLELGDFIVEVKRQLTSPLMQGDDGRRFRVIKENGDFEVVGGEVEKPHGK